MSAAEAFKQVLQARRPDLAWEVLEPVDRDKTIRPDFMPRPDKTHSPKSTPLLDPDDAKRAA